MGREMSGEEVRERYIEKMGRDLGELFHATSSELIWIHWTWNQYTILFGDEQVRIDRLNEVAPFFFRIIQDVLFGDTLLAIARFVGPPESVNKPNLTIQRFRALLTDQESKDQLRALVDEAKITTAFAVDWRNRHLAHRDLDLTLGRSTEQLAPASREMVKQALSSLRDVVNWVEIKYCDSNTLYDFSSEPGDAQSLLYVIQQGQLHVQERHERWQRGDLRDDDFEPPEAI